MSRYYRQTYKVVVLTEDPAQCSLEDLSEAVSYGADCLHTYTMESCKEMTGKEAADALYDAGSEPGFFQLDDDGKKA